MKSFDETSLRRKALFKQMLADAMQQCLRLCVYELCTPKLNAKIRTYLRKQLQMFFSSGEVQYIAASMSAADGHFALDVSAFTIWDIVNVQVFIGS